MESWPMLLGLLFMAALAGLDALLDRSQRRPMSWPGFLRTQRHSTWWTARPGNQLRETHQVSIGKEI